jgi:hypothetical protein
MTTGIFRRALQKKIPDKILQVDLILPEECRVKAGDCWGYCWGPN